MSSGGVVYLLTSREKCVLAEHTSTTGNFLQVTRLILEKVPTDADNKIAFSYDQHVFYIIVYQGFVFLAMCEESFQRRLAFGLLEDVKNAFMSQFAEEGKTAVAYALNRRFAPTLKDLLTQWNSGQKDKISNIRNQVEEVKTVMVKNIDDIFERGEKIELLVDKAEEMNQQAVKFKQVSGQLKRKMWWQNMKLIGVIVVIVIIVILIIVLSLKPWQKKDS